MKKFIMLVIFLTVFCSAPVLALDAPTLTVTTSGTNVSASWTSVPDATGYTLFYAPYPDAYSIGQIGMGTQTSISVDADGFALYVAIQSYNNSGSSEYSNIEYFDLSSSDPIEPDLTCGAYIAPGVWKEFDCYNLAAIGKTTNDDPFTPSWGLIGGYWQWGWLGPDSSQWYDTNTVNFAHGPTGPDLGDANDGEINGWDDNYASDGSWSDNSKTANDPCPDGYRVPTKSLWDGVIGEDNNTQSVIGSWSSSATNYSSARFFGNDLMLPAAGYRSYSTGLLDSRGQYGYYWSSTQYASYYAYDLSFTSSPASTLNYSRRKGFSVRCVAE